MRERLISAGSGALRLGLICALIGGVADAVVLSRVLSLGTLALYFLCGWVAGFVFSIFNNRVTPPLGGVILVSGVFSLYPLNIFLLAGEPWSSSKSLGVDVLVCAASGLLILLLRTRSLRQGPTGRWFSLLGLVLAGASSLFLFPGSAAPAPDRQGTGPDILFSCSIRCEETT